RAFDLEGTSGSNDLGDSGLMLQSDIAAKLHKGVGDSLAMGFPKGPVTLPIKGVYANNQTIGANYVIALADFERQYVEQQDAIIFAVAKAGVTPSALTRAIERDLKTDFHQIDVLDQNAFAAQQAEQIRGLLAVVNALLMLS